MNNFSLIQPRTIKQALDELTSSKGGPAKLKAGGIDLLDMMKEGIEQPARLVNIRHLNDPSYPLRDIAEVKAESIPEGVWQLLPGGDNGNPPQRRDCIRLGALVTVAQLAAHPLLKSKTPALSEAAVEIATPQIRQVATLSGNLLQRPRCWYFRSVEYPCAKKGGSICFAREGENDFHAVFDNQPCAAVHPSGTAVPLVALDAVVQFVTPLGERFARLSSFLVGPSQPGGAVARENRLEEDMLLVALWIPSPLAGERSLYRKVKQKQSFDWPLAEVAINIRRGLGGQKPLEAARIVLGSVAPVPYRARSAESLLLQSPTLDADRLRKIGQAAVSTATPLAKNGYKIPLISGLVQQALAELFL
ncbi:MAG TPA: FAD binding domain-containing protein [Pseudomonadota bacterium]|nr:FAD binding domain-containing protein [Pseudomonadota bacterium]HNI59449.1 FAD binding domain-containing protein [Pseudomonadota bacterium]HNN52244.1 FAD binding domain-containing protein [Pseudomonadota bacterium]HNO67689.1 FAD binding domain-containing protein [Pseudomonadota bacterium]